MITHGRKKHETTSPSILDKHSTIQTPATSAEDGVDYINVDFHSSTDLGRRLSMVYSKPFFTILGQTANIKTFAAAITIPNYPAEFIRKYRLTSEDFKQIPKERVSVPNYWALIAYAFCEKVKADKDLQKMLKENTLPFTAISGNKEVNFFNTTLVMAKPNFQLGKYVAIIRLVSDMIKNGTFKDQEIKDFIVSCKDVPEVDLLEGVACKLLIKQPTAKEISAESSEPEVVEEVVEETTEVVTEEVEPEASQAEVHPLDQQDQQPTA